jgi:titin
LLFPSSSFSAWVYSEDNKSGDKRCFWDSVANLGDHSWNLKIQSIEVFDHDACPHTPNPPTHMYSVNTTQTGTTLHWIDNSDNETRFIIYKDDVRAYYPPQNAEQYQISDLACGTSYSFEVSADWEGVGGESQKAGPLTVTTGPCPEPLPPMPTNLQTTGATESSVSLSWNSVLEADSYLVERNSGSSWYLAGIVYGSGNNSYTVTGLECATAHSFRVHSRNGAGDSAASSEVSAATASCPPPLAQPNDFAVSGSTQTSISFTWTDTNDNEDGYRLYQQDGMFLFPILETDPNVTSVTAEGLDCSETRSYSLAAFKGSDESSWSSLVSGSTDPCLTEPAAPSNLYADNLDMEMGTVDLHWQDNSDNEDGFILLFSFGTEGPFYEFWTTGPNVTMVTAEQLDCSMTYRYSIMAFNDAGRSNNISPITLTTDTCPEDLPTPTPTPQPTPTPTTPPPELQNKIYLPAVFK